MAAAKETSMDAAAVVVLSELEGILTSKEEHKNISEGVSRSEQCFNIVYTWFALLRVPLDTAVYGC